MRNIKLTLSYDGSDFSGWQTQPRFRTVQETVEAAIHALTGERVNANASGRTDTGVHAVGQVANFYTQSQHSTEVLVRALNAHLPDDVVVRQAADMPEAFDANRDARRKLYRYVIHDGPVPDPFLRHYCHQSRHPLDAAVMSAAAKPHLSLNRVGEWIWIDVEADGFLYNMVRAIAGTLIDVGRGYRSASQIAEILEAEDRRQAGPTAPAQGLFLMRVTY
jgi:tRNA pseudouridine38-40 synthase